MINSLQNFQIQHLNQQKECHLKQVGKDVMENKQMCRLCFTYCKTNLFHVHGNINQNLIWCQVINGFYRHLEQKYTMIVMKKTGLLLLIINSQESHKIVLIQVYGQGNINKMIYIAKKVINIRHIVLLEVKVHTLKQLTLSFMASIPIK